MMFCILGHWSHGGGKGVNVLFQQTFKQLVTLSGRNETNHWTDSVELIVFLYLAFSSFTYLKEVLDILTHMIVFETHEFQKPLDKGCKGHNMFQTNFFL